MAQIGNTASVSDAGVGALAARAAIHGAALNVKINAVGLADKETANNLIAEANQLVSMADNLEKETLDIVNSKIMPQ